MGTINILGKNIKKIRESKNISAYKLADLANVGTTTISEIENGIRQSLNTSTLEKIANALNIEINELFKVNGEIKYISYDIESKLKLMLNSENLTLDNIKLTELEIKQLNMSVSYILQIIRLQRDNYITKC